MKNSLKCILRCWCFLCFFPFLEFSNQPDGEKCAFAESNFYYQYTFIKSFFTLLIATWHARAEHLLLKSLLFSAIASLNKTLKGFQVPLTLFLFHVIKLKIDNSQNGGGGKLLRSRYVLRSRACYGPPNLKSTPRFPCSRRSQVFVAFTFYSILFCRINVWNVGQ